MTEETDSQTPTGSPTRLPASACSGPSGFGWVTRENPLWEDWGAWSSRILVMTHSDGPMVVYVPENGLPEYEHQDELADADEWFAWSEIPRVQNDQTVPTSGADTRENYQTTKTMTEETDSQTTTHQPQRLAPVPCYALPPEGIRHLHDEAAKLEKQAIPLMSDGFLHDAYCKLEISHSLRVTANYCDGTSVNLV